MSNAKRLFLTTSFVATIVAVTSILNIASAQSGFMNLAPLSKIGRFSHSNDLNTSLILLGIERSMPIGALLPQVTPDSYLTFMRAMGGVNLRGDKIDFRGQATALGFEIQKMPWAAALSVIDVDASGYRTFSADWLSLGIGPGLDLGNRDFRISGRAIGVGSFNSTRFGSEVLSFSGTDAKKTRQSISYGVRGLAGMNFYERIHLGVRYDLSRYSHDAGIENSNLAFSIDVLLLPSIILSTTYEQLLFKLGGEKIEIDGIRFELSLTPAAAR